MWCLVPLLLGRIGTGTQTAVLRSRSWREMSPEAHPDTSPGGLPLLPHPRTGPSLSTTGNIRLQRLFQEWGVRGSCHGAMEAGLRCGPAAAHCVSSASPLLSQLSWLAGPECRIPAENLALCWEALAWKLHVPAHSCDPSTRKAEARRWKA